VHRRGAFVTYEHFWTERPGTMGNNRGRDGPYCRGNGRDGAIRNRKDEYVHAIGGERRIIGTTENSHHFDPGRLERPSQGCAYTPGSDYANRRHGELFSFQPCRGAVRVSV
jgi:hypothetical protein